MGRPNVIESIIPSKGLNKLVGSTMLLPENASEVGNMVFREGALSASYGQSLFLSTNQPQSYPINHFAYFEKDDTTLYTFAFSEDEIYQANTVSKQWVAINSSLGFTFDDRWQTESHYNNFYAVCGDGRIYFFDTVTPDFETLPGTRGGGDGDDIEDAKVVFSAWNRLGIANFTQSSSYYPRRILMTPQGQLTHNVDGRDWNDISGSAISINVGEAGDRIVQCKLLDQYMIVYFEDAIGLLWYVGGSVKLNDTIIMRGTGIVGPDCVGTTKDAHYFMSRYNIHRLDRGNSVVAIGDPIKDELFRDINATYMSRSHVQVDEENNNIIFWVPVGSEYPNIGYVYNTLSGEWTKLARSCIANARVKSGISYTIGDLTDTIGSYSGIIGDWGTSSVTPIALSSDSTGYIFVEDTTTYNVGSESQTFLYETPDFTANTLVAGSRVGSYLTEKVTWKRLRFEASGTKVNIDYSLDGGQTYSQLRNESGLLQPFVLEDEFGVIVVDFAVFSPKIRFRFYITEADQYFNLRYFGVTGRLRRIERDA